MNVNQFTPGRNVLLLLIGVGVAAVAFVAFGSSTLPPTERAAAVSVMVDPNLAP